MRTFSSGREAKEYLIAQIVLEAEREGMPLSETERKMMYFTETAWTLPDIWEVNEVFERDYDHLLVKLPISRLFRDRGSILSAGESAGRSRRAARPGEEGPGSTGQGGR